MKTLKNPLIFKWALGISVAWLMLSFALCVAVNDFGWMLVSLLGLICLHAYFYFSNSVGTDDVGLVTYGGKPIENVDSGFVYVIPLIFSLEIIKWRMQYNFAPATDPEEKVTEKSITCALRPIQFEGRPGSKDPYEQQITTTPYLSLPVSVEDQTEFFNSAYDHEGGADLICEFINAMLLEIISDDRMTFRDFIKKLRFVEQELTEAMKTNETLKKLGLEAFGAGIHKGIQILNPGVPSEVVAAEKGAMSAVAKIAQGRAEGEAIDQKADGEASAINKKGEATAHVAGLTEHNLQEARSTGFNERVAALIKEGVSPDVAAAMVAQEAMAGAIAENENLLVANMGGGGGGSGGMLYGLNLTDGKSRKAPKADDTKAPKDDNKKGGK